MNKLHSKSFDLGIRVSEWNSPIDNILWDSSDFSRKLTYQPCLTHRIDRCFWKKCFRLQAALSCVTIRRLLIEVPEVQNMEPKTNAPERKTSCFWKPSCSTSTFFLILGMHYAHPFPLQIELIVPSVCHLCGRIRVRTPRSSVINAHREFPPLSAGLSIMFEQCLRLLQLRCGSYQL